MPLAEAILLATVDAGGLPDARMVLLKGIGPEGFRFFTNYESAKGRQLEPPRRRAALVVYWRELDRQVRARGPVERLAGAESDAYFATRPRESQLGAWASPQSRPLGSREELDERRRRGRRRASPSGRDPAAAALGRLPAAPGRGRVLAGPGRPAARPVPLHAATAAAGRSSGSAP